MRPICPTLRRLRVTRNSDDADEDQQRRQPREVEREEQLTISAVPTSAPSITASAGAVPIRPWPTNDGDDQRGRGAALDEAGDADAGERTR